MIITLTLVGLILGMAVAGIWGAAFGALTGFLVAQISRLNRQVQALIADQILLREELRHLSHPPAHRASPPEATNPPVAPESVGEEVESRAPEPEPDHLPSHEPLPESSSVPLKQVGESHVIARADASLPESNPENEASVSAWSPPASDVTGAPDGLSRAWSSVYRFLTEGNVVAKIGVIVLFFGLAFLLKYAADQALFPISVRLTLVGLGGLVLLGIGWYLRERHTGYALVLQGGGIGLTYLTLYAAFRLYGLLPAGVTMGLMLLVVAAAAVLAVVQDARSLAVLGIIGGFLAPILAGSDSGRHVDLFSYYLVLDFGIVFVAWRKAWRELNLLAFLFTFVIGTIWGGLNYKPALFSTTEPFLIGFYLIFLATALLFARQQRADGLRDYVQSTLVFGPPLVGFGLQAALVQNFEYGLAWSAFGLGILYLVLWLGLRRAVGEYFKILNDAFLLLGLGFVSLAAPFAFDGQWTSTTWALEGAAMLWVGLRQGKTWPVVFGLLLQLGAGVAFGDDPPSLDPTHWPLLDGYFLSGGLIALSGLASAYLLRNRRNWAPVPALLTLWGLAWWFGTGFYDLAHVASWLQPFTLWLMFASASMLVAQWLRQWLSDWSVLRYLLALQTAWMWALGGLIFLLNMSPFHEGGWFAWILAFATLYGGLYWSERRGESVFASERLHGLGVWLLVPVLAPQLADAIFRGLFGFTLDFGWFDLGPRGIMHPNTPGVWTVMSWGLIPVLLLSWVGSARHWPFAERSGHAAAYRGWVASGLGVFLMGWMFIVNGPWVTDPVMGAGWAQPAQIGYLPLFNALDFVSALALFALWRHGRLTGAYFLNYAGERTQQVLHWLMGAAAFVWLNAMIARSLNAYAGLPLDDGRFLHEALAQTTYSIAWSLLGLVLIVLASRLKQRRLWLVAAGLLGVVVLKLFLVDLSGSDTLARIISFVGVGVLLLLAGYIAPIPAKQAPSANDDQNTDDSEQ
ncbi:DUF2339 domain-containing protein [Halothiobacillus sp.]|uniref:DUF2339 domain-containing protein n=1 Tax=Halothiobacillus sp. TaxID=1891311 RepID=UPI002633F8DA|nr:DUF2339 domain-containing protein [Halothiobacillus sp.]MDD4965729.1 DUF2339 domain-containing protein [Halothiobacillus sp.]